MSSQYDDLLRKYQEQEATIKSLKAENIALKSQVDGLKNEVNQQKVAVDSLSVSVNSRYTFHAIRRHERYCG